MGRVCGLTSRKLQKGTGITRRSLCCKKTDSRRKPS